MRCVIGISYSGLCKYAIYFAYLRSNEMNLAAASVVYERIKSSQKLSAFTQEAIAIAAKVHQSQVSRILKGDFRRVSENVMRICKFADISFTQEQALSPRLQRALESVWDGSRGQEAALVKLLGAAGGLSLVHSASGSGGSRRPVRKKPRRSQG